MKIGDEVIAFGSPFSKEYPIGKVKLVNFITDTPNLELWYVERPDGQFAELFIKKDDDGENRT
jgi:hypothetical protein